MQVLYKIVVALIVVSSAGGCVTSGSEANVSPPRIALVGDSWSLIMRFHGGFKSAFVEEGYRERQVRNIAIGWSYLGLTERRLSLRGIETHRFIQEQQIAKLERILERYPTIQIIHLSLGGADLLHDMPPDLPASEQEKYLREHVAPHIDAILAELERKFPDKLIALVGYDYLNFRDLRADHRRTQQRWEDLGRPEPVELNRMSLKLNEVQREVAARHPGVIFVNVLGLTKERLDPGSPLSEPSPREGLWKDGLHLSRQGNAALARRCLDAGYRERLMPLRDFRGRLIVSTGSRRSDR